MLELGFTKHTINAADNGETILAILKDQFPQYDDLHLVPHPAHIKLKNGWNSISGQG